MRDLSPLKDALGAVAFVVAFALIAIPWELVLRV